MTAVAIDPEITSRRGGQFLTFFLDEEEYGLEILTAQEIIGLMAITPLPNTPSFIRGIVNLRGRVIPVIDLRLKFGMETIAATSETCIIVVQVGHLSIGLVVDRVSEVTDIRDEDIEDPPSFGAGVDTQYLLGVAKSQETVRLLLDIEAVLGVGETEELEQLIAADQ